MGGGLLLPQSQPATSAWQLSDFLRINLQSAAAGVNGLAVLDAGQLPSDELWLIDHAVISCTSANDTTLRLYESVADPLRLLDGSDRGNFDVADWPAGLQLHPSTSLVAVWAGATPGARGVLTLQGRKMRRA